MSQRSVPDVVTMRQLLMGIPSGAGAAGSARVQAATAAAVAASASGGSVPGSAHPPSSGGGVAGLFSGSAGSTAGHRRNFAHLADGSFGAATGFGDTSGTAGSGRARAPAPPAPRPCGTAVSTFPDGAPVVGVAPPTPPGLPLRHRVNRWIARLSDLRFFADGNPDSPDVRAEVERTRAKIVAALRAEAAERGDDSDGDFDGSRQRAAAAAVAAATGVSLLLPSVVSPRRVAVGIGASSGDIFSFRPAGRRAFGGANDGPLQPPPEGGAAATTVTGSDAALDGPPCGRRVFPGYQHDAAVPGARRRFGKRQDLAFGDRARQRRRLAPGHSGAGGGGGGGSAEDAAIVDDSIFAPRHAMLRSGELAMEHRQHALPAPHLPAPPLQPRRPQPVPQPHAQSARAEAGYGGGVIGRVSLGALKATPAVHRSRVREVLMHNGWLMEREPRRLPTRDQRQAYVNGVE